MRTPIEIVRTPSARSAGPVLLFRFDGHKVYVAYDGHQALKSFNRHLPDAALLDVGMPKRPPPRMLCDASITIAAATVQRAQVWPVACMRNSAPVEPQRDVD